MNTKELDKQYVAHTYGRFDLEICRGEGSLVYDENGKRYIDLGTGIAVNTFGVSDKEWISAVTKQLEMVQHTSNLYYCAPSAKLAEELCLRTGMKKVFFSNSGAEANECAIKTARAYAADKKGKDTYKIITLINSFHGRTITTLAATGQDSFHQDFTPLTEGFLYAKANDIESVKTLCEENKVAAIMFEVVQGEGGVLKLDEDFVQGVYGICKEKDILLIVDEVQTGNGRTGELYGYMHYGITPDIVTTAKGLGGGLPIGACLMGEKVEFTLGAGKHGSTFGGNPIACAGAINILSRLDDELLASVREKSEYIFNTLNGKKGVVSVSGLGLMVGIKLEKDTSSVIAKLQERGVLAIKAKDKLRLLPALNIPMELLQEAIDIIIDVVGEE